MMVNSKHAIVLLISITVIVGFSGMGAAMPAEFGNSQSLDSAGDGYDSTSDHDDDGDEDKGHGNECDNHDEDNSGNSDGRQGQQNSNCDDDGGDQEGDDNGDHDKGHGNECDGNDEDNSGNSDGRQGKQNPNCDDGNNGGGGGGGGDANPCEQRGAFDDETIAHKAFGTENEEGPISSGLHDSEGEFGDLQEIIHEGSCVVATVDNNFQ